MSNTIRTHEKAAIAVGRHMLVDFHGCPLPIKAEELRDGLVDAARAAGATVLGSHFHNFAGNAGATAFVMASFLERPYIEIALAATIPSILYYFGLFAQMQRTFPPLAARIEITEIHGQHHIFGHGEGG